jgi:outer membrane protein OmpA-like peptidoglycan-associated protein
MPVQAIRLADQCKPVHDVKEMTMVMLATQEWYAMTDRQGNDRSCSTGLVEMLSGGADTQTLMANIACIEIGFSQGQYIHASESSKLDDIAAVLLKLHNDAYVRGESLTVIVEGHSDSTGNVSANARVARERAEAIMGELAVRGVGTTGFVARRAQENLGRRVATLHVNIASRGLAL